MKKNKDKGTNKFLMLFEAIFIACDTINKSSNPGFRQVADTAFNAGLYRMLNQDRNKKS